MTKPHPLDAETWLFDLDNTLYHHRYDLFCGVSSKMTQYIMERFSLAFDAALARQKDYFQTYGTTLRGLMLHHDVDPEEFLDYVHDIDYSILPPNPRLNAVLGRLSARKIIFTNGTVKHARAVIKQLGIAEHFTEFFDITDAGYTPKPEPEPYQFLIARYGIDPHKVIMIDDIAANLYYPNEVGMQTVFIETAEDWAQPDTENAHRIDYRTDDVTLWLEEVLQ